MTDIALEEVRAAAARISADQGEVIRRAGWMQRQRRRGWSWSRILDEQPSPGIVEMLRRSGRLVARATAALTVAMAAELTAEGVSRRQVARYLGVSHQRVSAVLRGRDLSS